MSEAQLKAAATLTSAKPVQKKATQPPKARASSLALKATPAPARGPEDELLFDPDEESYGEGGPGAGYDVGDVNIPVGVQQGTGATTMEAVRSTPVGKDTDDAGEPDEPLVIDLEDDPKTPPPESQNGLGLTFWLLLIGGLVVCGFSLLMMLQRGGSSSSVSTGSVGMDLANPYAGLGTFGGSSSGMGLSGGLGAGSLM